MPVPHRLQLDAPPVVLRHGETYGYLPPKLVRNKHELALTLAWICHRKLWGETYLALQPDYFWRMPRDGGVLLRPIVTTEKVAPGATKPGDIDLMVIPYQGKELVLERTLVMEIKAIRASFAKQGKSPNEFGFSQANGLTSLGFPYVALVHLIVSDQAPEHTWRMMGRARILDSNGRAEILTPAPHDMLPADLMNRAFGRLQANSRNSAHGLAAVYLEGWSEEAGRFDMDGFWYPNCRVAASNDAVSYDLLNRVGNYYKRNAASFLATPMYDPA